MTTSNETISAAQIGDAGDVADSATPQVSFNPVIQDGQYIAGRSVFPGAVMEGLSESVNSISYQEFVQRTALACTKADRSLSYITYEANQSGSDGGRFYFGYIFAKALEFPADFTLDLSPKNDVQHTTAANKSRQSTAAGSDPTSSHEQHSIHR